MAVGDGDWRFELHLRGAVSRHAERQQQRVRERLRSTVESVETREWAKRVPRDGDAEAVARYEAFLEWADDRDVSMTPFFRTRAAYSRDTGERYEALVPPVICLAAYRDGELATVYPHVEDGTVRTVADGLASLEAGRLDATADADEGAAD